MKTDRDDVPSPNSLSPVSDSPIVDSSETEDDNDDDDNNEASSRYEGQYPDRVTQQDTSANHLQIARHDDSNCPSPFIFGNIGLLVNFGPILLPSNHTLFQEELLMQQNIQQSQNYLDLSALFSAPSSERAALTAAIFPREKAPQPPAALPTPPPPPRPPPPRLPQESTRIVCRNCSPSAVQDFSMTQTGHHHQTFCCKDAYVYSLPPWKRQNTKNLDPDGRILRETIADNTAMIRKFNELCVSNPSNVGFSTVHVRQALEFDQMRGTHGRINQYQYYNDKGYPPFPPDGERRSDPNNSNSTWNGNNNGGGGGGGVWGSRSASAPCTPRQGKLGASNGPGGPSPGSPKRPSTASSALIPYDSDMQKSSEALQSIIEKKFNDVIASKKQKKKQEEVDAADVNKDAGQFESPPPQPPPRGFLENPPPFPTLDELRASACRSDKDRMLLEMLETLTQQTRTNEHNDHREEPNCRMSPPPGFAPKVTPGRTENLHEMETMMQFSSSNEESSQRMVLGIGNVNNVMGLPLQYANYTPNQNTFWPCSALPQDKQQKQQQQRQNDRMGDSSQHTQDRNNVYQEDNRRRHQQAMEMEQQHQHETSASRNVFGPTSVYEETMTYFGTQRSYPPHHQPHQFGGRCRVNQTPTTTGQFPAPHPINMPQQQVYHHTRSHRHSPQPSRNHPYLPPQTMAVVPNYRAVVSPPPGQFFTNNANIVGAKPNRTAACNGSSSVSYPRGMWADVGRCNNNSVAVTQLIHNAVRVGLSAGAAAMNNAQGRPYSEPPMGQSHSGSSKRSTHQQGESSQQHQQQQQNDPPLEVLHQRSLVPTGSSEALLEETKKQMMDSTRRSNSTRPFPSSGGRNEETPKPKEDHHHNSSGSSNRHKSRHTKKEESHNIGSSSDSLINTWRHSTGDPKTPTDKATPEDSAPASSSVPKPNRAASLSNIRMNVNLRPVNLATPPCAAPRPKKSFGSEDSHK